MRARHRHFNPKDAGAAGVYDSRYISFANAAEVDTWSSRTGSNNMTQSISSNRPIYRTNEINGNPAVEFDGIDDSLATSSPATTSQTYSMLLFFKNSSTTDNRIYLGNGNPGSNGYHFYRWVSGAVRLLVHGGSGLGTFGSITTSWELWTASRASASNAEVWLNGVKQTLASGTPNTVNTPTGNTYMGIAGSFPQAMISSAIIIGSSINASLRRKIESSIAFSFKHPIF